MNIMTVDVEDWYHCVEQEPGNWSQYEDRIVGSTGRLLEVLDRTGTKATFFVLGHVAESFPDLVREIHDQGHEIASHGCEHRFVYRQRPEEFETDVSRSISLLYSIVDTPIRGYRAPYFSITRQSLWAFSILKKLNIQYDSSVFPVMNHRYGIPDAPRLPHRTEEGLMEIPLSTFPVAFPVGRVNVPCGGGVYFRVFPYAVTRRLLDRLNKRDEPIVFYLHPWELDSGQPRIPMPPALRVRHYWGLDKTAEKLTRLLREFHFDSVRGALEL